ncbi:hypothetical protein [Pirellula sp. SH-Sr6A]|uniref:hypothetical protein n=1 Tax=Pirellula sp. SH-Sr6A TaxID=1632865 RepID=UPI0011BACA06|nr:hypothetical protein [Pirellula sp. SH-Sr6A]
MQNLSRIRIENGAALGRSFPIGAICCAAWAAFAFSPLLAQNAPPTNGPNGAAVGPSATGADGFARPQLSSTFTDSRTGQLYGRYIIYETVPVVTYQQQEVSEQQWVPEWVTEEKLLGQTNYIPIVTYQLQLRSEPTLNPFAPPRQSWQYVPVVQYQPNFTQVKQPVTYQKYVQKEVKKSIPVLVSQSQPRAKFVDMPMQNAGAGAAQVAGGGSVQPPVPTRPLDTPTYPSSAIVMTPPPVYYPNTGGAPNSSPASNLAAYPAYNPQYSGWNATNPWLLARQQSASNIARNVNNPTANGGLPPGSYGTLTAGTNPPATGTPGNMPANYGPMLAARPNFQWPQLMGRTGSLFPGGLFKSNASTPGFGTSGFGASGFGMGGYGTANSGATYVASNPSPIEGGALLPVANATGYPFTSAGNNSVRFIPRTDAYPLGTPNSSWSMVPVNNYRDPTQSGIPASVLR